MANIGITQLKAQINATITPNGQRAITGALLNDDLIDMVDTLTQSGYTFMGVATPATNPGTPVQNVFYMAGPGTYTHFGNLSVAKGDIGLLMYSSSWSMSSVLTGTYHVVLTQTGGTITSSDTPAAIKAAYDAGKFVFATIGKHSCTLLSAETASGVTTAIFVRNDEKSVATYTVGTAGVVMSVTDLRELLATEEEGLHIVDEQSNDAFKVDEDGTDFAKVSEHLRSLLESDLYGGALATTAEAGFYVVDGNLKIGMKVDQNGVHAKNLLEFSIVSE